jgi:threonine/homoserine/homoserine lactone efflux protein
LVKRAALSTPITREMQRRVRSRAVFLALTVATIVIGLASRRFRRALPAAVGLYAGDVLWATMVYLLAAAIWPRTSMRRLAVGAAAFALAIEVGQLYHAPWIDAVRNTRLGGLVLGFGFLWSDLACYAVGIALALLIDRVIASRRVGAIRGIA